MYSKRVPPGPSSPGRKRGIEPGVGSARGRGGIGRLPLASATVRNRPEHSVPSGGSAGPVTQRYPAGGGGGISGTRTPAIGIGGKGPRTGGVTARS
jgi:hypothetical protein